MNTATSFPMALEQVPISAFGGGVIVIPREDLLLSVTALDPTGTPDNNNIGKAFSQGVEVVGSGTLTIKPYGLLGHQTLGFEWNNENRFSLTQDPTNLGTFLLQTRFPRLANPGPVLEGILARRFPNLLVPARPPNRSESSWAFDYTFDQYLWQPDGNPHHGIGLFFGFGASDGNPNPIQYSFLGGLGGKGVVPGRPDDNFGVAFARTEFSSAFLPFLRQQLNLGLQREDAIEMFYNVALTPWLNVTGDLQIVKPGIKKALNNASQLAGIDTAVVAGARVRVRF
jgi:porin